jgi:hypothetical protein
VRVAAADVTSVHVADGAGSRLVFADSGTPVGLVCFRSSMGRYMDLGTHTHIRTRVGVTTCSAFMRSFNHLKIHSFNCLCCRAGYTPNDYPTEKEWQVRQ